MKRRGNGGMFHLTPNNFSQQAFDILWSLLGMPTLVTRAERLGMKKLGIKRNDLESLWNHYTIIVSLNFFILLTCAQLIEFEQML